MADFIGLSSHIQEDELLVFFDCEGTQFSHDPIAIGVKAYEKEAGTMNIGKEVFSYMAYIKTEKNIGSLITEMTGIDKDLLDHEGIEYDKAIKDIIAFTRKYKFKRFISYGGLDLRMMRIGMKDYEGYLKDFYSHVKNHYFDFHAYLSKRMVDEKGHTYSISSLLFLYKIKMEGKAHNPLYDAEALAKIFFAYLSNPDYDVELIEKNILVNPFVAKSVYRNSLRVVMEKGVFTLAELEEYIRNNL